MELEAARLLAGDLMSDYELDEWTFGFDSAKNRLGLCRHTVKRLQLSRYFVAGATEAEVRDTMLHEIAHALLSAKEGHGRAWKALYRSIGGAGGRTGNMQSPPPRYRGNCLTCGTEFKGYRRPAKGLRHTRCYNRDHEFGKIEWLDTRSNVVLVWL